MLRRTSALVGGDCAETFVDNTERHLLANAQGRRIAVIDPKRVRPAEVHLLISNPRRAREELGWTPKVSFSELVRMMVDADVALVARGLCDSREKAARLLLAGDWIATGLPATIESAAMSGHRAAEAIIGERSQPVKG